METIAEIAAKFAAKFAGVIDALAKFAHAVADTTISFVKLAVARYASDVARLGERTAAALRVSRTGRTDAQYLAAVDQMAARWRDPHQLLLDLLPDRLRERVMPGGSSPLGAC